GGATAAVAHDLRFRNDAADGLLQRHRKLLTAYRWASTGQRTTYIIGLFPGRFLTDCRRIARYGPTNWRGVRRRCLTKAHPGRPWFPVTLGIGYPAFEVGRISGTPSSNYPLIGQSSS